MLKIILFGCKKYLFCCWERWSTIDFILGRKEFILNKINNYNDLMMSLAVVEAFVSLFD
jgi:hypothetical protein